MDKTAVHVARQERGDGTDGTKAAGNLTVIPAPSASGNVLKPNGQPPTDPVSTAGAPAATQPPAGTQPPATQPPATTDTTQTEPTEPLLTLEAVAARRTAAEQTPDLTEDLKAQLTRSFQRAIDSLTQKADADKRAAELKADKDNGPALIAEQRALLAQPPPKAEPEYLKGATVAELDQLRLADEDRAAVARSNLETWETKARLRSERKPQMPALIEATRKQLAEAEKSLGIPSPEGEQSVLSIARKTEQEALVVLLRSQLELYRIEQLRYEALNELFPLQRDVLTRVRTAADKRVELWKTVLADARREESARQAQEARQKLQDAHPTLRDLAEKNASLTARRKELQDFLASKVKELSDVNAVLTSVETKFSSVTEKEQRAGLTTAIGLLLRSQRAHLPDAALYRRKQKEAEADIVRLQSEQMPLEDERGDLSDLESQTDLTLELIALDGLPDEDLRQMTDDLLLDRRQYLDDLLGDYDKCLQALGETDVACRRLETMIHEYKSYIDERVLWIRSAATVDTGFFGRTLQAAEAFAAHRQWPSVVRNLISDSRLFWPLYGLMVAGFALIFGFNRTLRNAISRLGETAEKQLSSGIPLALLSTAFTVITASAWPALLWFAGWRLNNFNLDLANALGDAFLFCAPALWAVETFRLLCRKDGVTISFLEWPRTIVRSLYANLLWYVAGGIPLAFIVVAAGQLDDGASEETVGRFCFVVFCGLLAVILRRLVRPDGPVLGDLLRSNPTSLMYRLRWLWYPLAVGSPLCLALLALMGFQYTAEQLMVRLQLTLGLSFSFVIAYSMAMQWMLAARRNLALNQARARRAAAQVAAQRESEEHGGSASSLPPVEIPQIDLSLLNQQMLRLVRGTAVILFLTMSWAIWGRVLPALQVFNRIELWHVVVEAAERVEGTDGASTLREVSSVVPVSLGDLLFAIVVFAAALVASRNVPGLLELAVLQRLPLDHGGRNAITTLCRYVLVLAGVVISCNAIGIVWSSVQWLVAALTVGLGFGLQEIFANFVSGLIILFERPIRIGDIVTIDNIDGCITRIQIRATTIMDWDRKEYIVPNKEFVTGKVLNWTLSDKVNRIVIKIGVAYGSDVEQALRLLSEACEEHPLVLTDPAPVIGFEGFGESCLDLVLRCFLPNFEQRLKVITQLHMAIDQKFREAGIEISFPQRDLHIRSLPPNFGVAVNPQAATDAEIPDAQPHERDEVKQQTKRSA